MTADSVRTTSMAEGVIKWFDPKKGYGFIDGNGQPDIFIHHTNFKTPGLRVLNQGDKISFEIVQGEKGPRADAVELVTPPIKSDS
jgi:CspA family cold shock protein